MSSRMGRPKLSLELAPGKRLGAAALAEVLACEEIERVIAVVRENDGMEWWREAKAGDSLGRLEAVACQDSRLGMSFSIRSGLDRALAEDPDAVLIVLADQPFLASSELTSLVRSAQKEEALDYAAFGRRGKAHPPVLFKRAMFAALAGLRGDEGARRLLADGTWRGKLLEIDAEEFFADVDTLDDWRRASSRSAGESRDSASE